MKDLIIIGAGGLGRSICTLFSTQSNYKNLYSVKGFLDDDSSALDGFNGYPPVIDSVENYTVKNNDVFFCALGSINDRKRMSSIILNKGGEFISCISEHSIVAPNAKIGKGVFLNAYSCVDAEVCIDDFTYVFTYCSIGHDTTIGEFCQIEPFCAIGGHVNIGNSVTLHPRATILPRICIGDGANVGVSSVVMRNVDEKQTVFGNPAVVLKI